MLALQSQKWPGEPPGLCCSKGKVKLCELQKPPEELSHLLSSTDSRAKKFQDNIWHYKSAFMMTSFGADKDLTDRGFFTTFKSTRTVLS